jgi:hypothetical protein
MELGLAVVAVVVACIPIGVSLWALLDVAHRPQWAWALVGRRQVAWLAAVLFGTLTVVGGLVIAIYYLTKVRPVIAAAEGGDLSALRRDPRAGGRSGAG